MQMSVSYLKRTKITMTVFKRWTFSGRLQVFRMKSNTLQVFFKLISVQPQQNETGWRLQLRRHAASRQVPSSFVIFLI